MTKSPVKRCGVYVGLTYALLWASGWVHDMEETVIATNAVEMLRKSLKALKPGGILGRQMQIRDQNNGSCDIHCVKNSVGD